MPLEPFDSLPPHLARVVPLLSEGLDNRELAARFVLAESTVKDYVSELKHIVEARHRVDLVPKCRARCGRNY